MNIFDALQNAKVDWEKGCFIYGDEKRIFTHPSTIENADEKSIVFVTRYKYKNKLKQIIKNTKASVVITEEIVGTFDNKTIVVVENPRLVFAKIINCCFPNSNRVGIHPTASIDDYASYDSSIYVGPKAVIGNCIIGKNVVIHANVVINDDVVIGDNVVIKPGCIIGFDGFGYIREQDNSLTKFPHHGNTIIEDDVHIGANVTIDRGTLGDTIIGKGTKIDNLVHIAHNNIIGQNVMIPAGITFSGSIIIGDNVWIGVGSVICDGITIGDDAFISIGSIVNQDVKPKTHVTGNFAIEHKKFIKHLKGMTK